MKSQQLSVTPITFLIYPSLYPEEVFLIFQRWVHTLQGSGGRYALSLQAKLTPVTQHASLRRSTGEPERVFGPNKLGKTCEGFHHLGVLVLLDSKPLVVLLVKSLPPSLL